MSGRPAFSRLDRLLHDLSFSTVGPQITVADIEDRLFAGRLATVAVDRPVFVTSLPRAGTTLLLDVLNTLPVFAAHSYREMPFVLLPFLWSTLSRRFRRSGGFRERAHGDGMTVGFDSVEAFEEVLWRAFWPQKYRGDRILLWSADEVAPGDEFAAFFDSHVRKLIALRQDEGARASRYLSKNNANVARLAPLLRLFPDATILVPFRNPLDHAASMLRQHRNFLEIHSDDPFARRYMAGIGHLEFGRLLRPIDFDGWLGAGEGAGLTSPNGPPPLELAYWLGYWCAAFAHLSATLPARAFLVDYDALCRDPAAGLQRIGAAIGLDDDAGLLAQGGRFRAPVTYGAAAAGLDNALLDRAWEIHRGLRAKALV